MADPVTGTFAATGQSAKGSFKGCFNLTISGTFVATMRLERTFDDGTTWHPCTQGGQIIYLTGPCSEVINEPGSGVNYRLNCTAYTSGTVTYRLSQ
jgi:hypothetical protein